MPFDPKTWANDELITAEDLNRLEQAVDAVDAKADATAVRVDAVEADLAATTAAGAATAAQVDQIKLANQSAGQGAPTGTAPVGWIYTDITTGDVYRMEA